MPQNDQAFPWEAPKVIVNAVRLPSARWPLSAMVDTEGLPYSEDFYGIWPTGELPIEILAAILNSPIGNAFISLRKRGSVKINPKTLIEQIPIPNFTKPQIRIITSLTKRYMATRKEWLSEPLEARGRLTGQGLFSRIEEEIMEAYRLSFKAERALSTFFAGHTRPGPFPLTKIKPSTGNALHWSFMTVRGVRKEEKEMVVDADLDWGNPPVEQIVHFPLTLVPPKMREQLIPGIPLEAQVNCYTTEAKNLVFEDVVISEPISEEFLANLTTFANVPESAEVA